MFKKMDSQTIARKIFWAVAAFFACSAAAAWLAVAAYSDIEGASSTMNDVGSLRMRLYRMAFMAAQSQSPLGEIEASAVRKEMADFEGILEKLEGGFDLGVGQWDSGEAAAKTNLDAVKAEWESSVKPGFAAALAGSESEADAAKAALFAQLPKFHRKVDSAVSRMEERFAKAGAELAKWQAVLAMVFALGAGALAAALRRWVVKPLGALKAGMAKNSAGDFAYRMEEPRGDEFGSVARGYNGMADRLQEVYCSLDERIRRKTDELEASNRELSILYKAASVAGEAASFEDLCEGFLETLKAELGAAAGAVRLDAPYAYGDGHSAAAPGCDGCRFGAAYGKCFTCDKDVVCCKMKEVGQEGCSPSGLRFVKRVPVESFQGRIGEFALHFSEPRIFGMDEERMLTALGRNLGEAVESLRLQSRETELAVSEERNILAQELHDSIAQGLAFLNIQAQMLQDAVKAGDLAESAQIGSAMREGVQESYGAVRELMASFRTRMKHASLEAAIVGSLEKFEKQTKIRTVFETTGHPRRFGAETDLQLMHMFQECLSNARKHSCAGSLKASLVYEGSMATLEVADDGGGFLMKSKGPEVSGYGMGMRILRERAERIGAKVAVESEPGAGTRVKITIEK